MKSTKLLGAMLAASLTLASLAGCATPSTAGAVKGTTGAKPGTSAGTTTNAGTTGAQPGTTTTKPVAAAPIIAASAASALSEERTMEDYSVTVDDAIVAAYALVSLSDNRGPGGGGTAGRPDGEHDPSPRPSSGISADASATGEAHASDAAHAGAGNADDHGDRGGHGGQGAEHGGRADAHTHLAADVRAKGKAHRDEAKAKAAKRVKPEEADKLKDAAKKSPWVTNADGSKTKTIESDVSRTENGQTVTRHVKMVRTVNADGDLLSEVNDVSATLPNGGSRTAHREKTLNADGTYHVTFTMTLTNADKSTRTVNWDKTIGTDGSVSGKGTVSSTDKDGKATEPAEVELGGSDDAPTAADPAGSTVATADTAPAATTDAAATTAAS
jgi:hypothetical protein